MRTLEELKPTIISVLEKYPVSKAGVFGSYARGEQTAESDLDILVEFTEEISLFEWIELEIALEEALNMEVDVVDYDSVKPLIKNAVLKDEIRIFESSQTLVPLR